MQLRTAALIGVLGLGLGWAVGSRMPASSPATPQGRGSAGPRPLGVGPGVAGQPFAEQLRLRLAHQPKAPHPSRNPFVFGARPSAAVSPRAAAPGLTSAAPAAPPAEIAPEPPPVPGSEFRLTGMAGSEGPEGTEFTAMIHDGQSLLFVKRGDTLPGGFEVVDVQEASVTLRDSAGGERTLRLR